MDCLNLSKQHNISEKVLCGESNDIDVEIMDNVKKRTANADDC